MKEKEQNYSPMRNLMNTWLQMEKDLSIITISKNLMTIQNIVDNGQLIENHIQVLEKSNMRQVMLHHM